ncbi:MAG: RpiB/LacA/LacB family sugar-phosphate isomerase [Rectinemataceae bacterium]|jgi:ribose 5-phosphate isomerase B
MRVAIGCDEAAIGLKEVLIKEIKKLGNVPIDLGVYTEDPSLYADTAVKVAERVMSGDCERGVLLCGTGIGMSIMANKVPGIRAALAHDTYSAERAVKSNNAQIITMGARVIGPEVAKAILKTFLESTFKDGPSTPKVERIMEYESYYHSSDDEASKMPGETDDTPRRSI